MKIASLSGYSSLSDAAKLFEEFRAACLAFVNAYDKRAQRGAGSTCMDEEIDGLVIVLDAWADYKCTGR